MKPCSILSTACASSCLLRNAFVHGQSSRELQNSSEMDQGLLWGTATMERCFPTATCNHTEVLRTLQVVSQFLWSSREIQQDGSRAGLQQRAPEAYERQAFLRSQTGNKGLSEHEDPGWCERSTVVRHLCPQWLWKQDECFGHMTRPRPLPPTVNEHFPFFLGEAPSASPVPQWW